MTNRISIQTIGMGEGKTPLIRLLRLEKKLGWKGRLWAKAEYMNPTGSFKDRGSVAELVEALRQRKSGVVCASTGNMAASLAAYAVRCRLKCTVIVPEGTPSPKLKQVTACGATVRPVCGGYDTCVEEAKSCAIENDFLLCGDFVTRRIGQRTIGTELADSGVVFDVYVCPVGNGTVGCAIAEGLHARGQSPSFIGVQGVGADPLAQSFMTGSPFVRINGPKTVASAMCVGNPLDGALTLRMVKRSGGSMLSVSDEEIRTAQHLLAATEGIFVESAAAATVAALERLDKTKRIVLILTGNGLKDIV